MRRSLSSFYVHHMAALAERNPMLFKRAALVAAALVVRAAKPGQDKNCRSNGSVDC